MPRKVRKTLEERFPGLSEHVRACFIEGMSDWETAFRFGQGVKTFQVCELRRELGLKLTDEQKRERINEGRTRYLSQGGSKPFTKQGSETGGMSPEQYEKFSSLTREDVRRFTENTCRIAMCPEKYIPALEDKAWELLRARAMQWTPNVKGSYLHWMLTGVSGKLYERAREYRDANITGVVG